MVRMTGATSTNGGGGTAARTLLLLQPSVFSRSTALTNAADICFVISFPPNRLQSDCPLVLPALSASL